MRGLCRSRVAAARVWPNRETFGNHAHSRAKARLTIQPRALRGVGDAPTILAAAEAAATWSRVARAFRAGLGFVDCARFVVDLRREMRRYEADAHAFDAVRAAVSGSEDRRRIGLQRDDSSSGRFQRLRDARNHSGGSDAAAECGDRPGL